MLRREIELLREERERERSHLVEQINDLKRRLDAEGEERRKLTAILTDQRVKTIITPPPEKPPAVKPASPALERRRWRLFGGRG